MKILVVDDHPLTRSGVRATLERAGEHCVVGEASTPEEALLLIEERRPDLITLDIEMPGMPLELFTEQAHKILPGLRILVLSAHDDEATVRRMLRLRISGYMLKDEGSENLLQALSAIQNGAAWFSQTVAHRMMGREASAPTLPTLPPLTRRERQVLEQIALGKDNQSIAEVLNLAEQTVRNYACSIYDKLGVKSRVEAAVWARERQLFDGSVSR